MTFVIGCMWEKMGLEDMPKISPCETYAAAKTFKAARQSTEMEPVPSYRV